MHFALHHDLKNPSLNDAEMDQFLAGGEDVLVKQHTDILYELGIDDVPELFDEFTGGLMDDGPDVFELLESSEFRR